jgi:hypothetical protein
MISIVILKNLFLGILSFDLTWHCKGGPDDTGHQAMKQEFPEYVWWNTEGRFLNNYHEDKVEYVCEIPHYSKLN